MLACCIKLRQRIPHALSLNENIAAHNNIEMAESNDEYQMKCRAPASRSEARSLRREIARQIMSNALEIYGFILARRGWPENNISSGPYHALK